MIPVTSIRVVVPARDEAGRLPVCLHALAVAAAGIGVPVRTVVVADRCQDATAAVAAAHRVRVVVSQVGRVGAARRIGFQAALSEAGAGLDPRHVWLATTDADSAVPPDWFARQLAHAGHGADVVVGTVTVADWSGYPPRVVAEYGRRYDPGDGHRHVHGANLSMRASSYLRAGGFAPLRCHEDVDLVERMSALGGQVVWAGDLPVATSARRDGRAPGGFARYLRELA